MNHWLSGAHPTDLGTSRLHNHMSRFLIINLIMYIASIGSVSLETIYGLWLMSDVCHGGRSGKWSLTFSKPVKFPCTTM